MTLGQRHFNTQRTAFNDNLRMSNITQHDTYFTKLNTKLNVTSVCYAYLWHEDETQCDSGAEYYECGQDEEG